METVKKSVGRPKGECVNRGQYTVMLDPEVKEMLVMLADVLRKSQSEIVNIAIRYYVGKHSEALAKHRRDIEELEKSIAGIFPEQ